MKRRSRWTILQQHVVDTFSASIPLFFLQVFELISLGQLIWIFRDDPMFLMNRNFYNFGKLVSKREFYCSIIFILFFILLFLLFWKSKLQQSKLISRPVNCYSFKDVEIDDSDRNFGSKLREYTRIMNSSKDRNWRSSLKSLAKRGWF